MLLRRSARRKISEPWSGIEVFRTVDYGQVPTQQLVTAPVDREVDQPSVGQDGSMVVLGKFDFIHSVCDVVDSLGGCREGPVSNKTFVELFFGSVNGGVLCYLNY